MNMRRRLSFRVKLSLTIVVIALIPFLIICSIYLNSKIKEMENMQNSEYEKKFSDECLQLKLEISSLLMKAELVKSDSEFNSRILQLDTMYLSEKMEMINRFKSISNIFLMDDMKCQVKWYTNQIDGPYGVYCYPLEEMSTTKSSDFLAHIDMKLYDYNIFIEEEGQSDNRNTELKLCLYEKIYESSKGVVVFEISKYLEDMNNIFADDYERKSEIKALLINNKLIDQLFVVESDNEGTKKQLVSDYLKEGELSGYYSFAGDIEGFSEIKLISLVNKALLEEAKANMIKSWVLILSIFCCVLFIVAYVTSYIITKKGIEVVSYLNDYLNNKSEKTKNLYRLDIDFHEMEKNLFDLMQKVQVSVSKIAQSEIEKKELELELLQLNFTPHLLYNTLLSIRFHTESTVLRNVIDSLIHYYQLILNHGKLTICIDEELNMIEEYLKLMIFTYDLQRVFFEIHIEDDAKEYVVPKGVLQPIVENALEHGIRKCKEEGFISIRVRLEEQEIVIEVEDDGCGMNREELDRVLLKIRSQESSNSYGLYNVQKRIQTFYGSDYGITIQSTIEKGTCVAIRLPKRCDKRYGREKIL